jgi:predicted RNA binding protein YcfA (HicA-like mRNA interferase family)
MIYQMATLRLKEKDMRKLVAKLSKNGLQISQTSRGHIRIKNPKTNQVIVISSGRSADYRTTLEIYKDLKKIGFNAREEE